MCGKKEFGGIRIVLFVVVKTRQPTDDQNRKTYQIAADKMPSKAPRVFPAHKKVCVLSFFLLHLQQDGGAQGDDTSSTGQHNLAGTSSDDSRLGRGVGSSALGVSSGGVVVGSGGARDGGRGGDGLGDRAGAVQDGQGGGRGDGVGLAVVSQESGLRAVGGQSRDDLGRVGDVAGRDGGGKGQDGSNRELHFDGWAELSRRRVREKSSGLVE